MLRSRSPESRASAERVLDLLDALVDARGASSLVEAAERVNLPLSTAHRLAAILVRRKLLARGDRGQYLAGWGLADLAGRTDWRSILVAVARPLARRLARRSASTIHIGVFDGDMVTYILKEENTAKSLFTREGMQLEAYCSAVGKVLLAGLPALEREAYLASAPFPALTADTITDPAALRSHLAEVAALDFAVDDREISEDLVCFAVPIRKLDGTIVAALSSAGRPPRPSRERALRDLRLCAAKIAERLF